MLKRYILLVMLMQLRYFFIYFSVSCNVINECTIDLVLNFIHITFSSNF